MFQPFPESTKPYVCYLSYFIVNNESNKVVLISKEPCMHMNTILNLFYRLNCRNTLGNNENI